MGQPQDTKEGRQRQIDPCCWVLAAEEPESNQTGQHQLISAKLSGKPAADELLKGYDKRWLTEHGHLRPYGQEQDYREQPGVERAVYAAGADLLREPPEHRDHS